jgi:hypothetical protein
MSEFGISFGDRRPACRHPYHPYSDYDYEPEGEVVSVVVDRSALTFIFWPAMRNTWLVRITKGKGVVCDDRLINSLGNLEV